MRETLGAQGLLLTPGSVDEFAKFQSEDMARSKKIIVEAATAPHAVVTGSSGGIGRAIASQLLEAGWRVSGIDLAAPTLSSHAGFTHTA
eukprot:gene42236-57181_t